VTATGGGSTFDGGLKTWNLAPRMGSLRYGHVLGKAGGVLIGDVIFDRGMAYFPDHPVSAVLQIAGFGLPSSSYA
jgi:hypothetical protein